MIPYTKACYCLASLLCLIFLSVSGQNPELADSLIARYDSGNYTLSETEILKQIAQEVTDPDEKLKYSELLIKRAAEDSQWGYLHSGYLQKGNALQLKANYSTALDAFFESRKFADRANDELGIGSVTISIADTYNMAGDDKTAQDYYARGIESLRRSNDSVSLASALLNAGDHAVHTAEYEKALEYLSESGEIFERLDYPIGIAYNLGNVGMVYAEQGKDELAKQNINEAISILEDLEQYYPISVYLRYMADIYRKQGDIPTAMSFAQRSLELAKKYHLKDQIADASLQLAEINAAAGNYREAYEDYRTHIIYRDSVTNVAEVQKMAELRNNFEIAQKQAEVDLLAQQKKTQKVIVIATALALFLILLLAIGLYRRNKFIKHTNKIIENERKRSDHLLLNILPERTANELKDYGKVQSQKFESVTVLFTDFKDFTIYSEGLPPEELVKNVDYYFSRFDEIIDKYGLEKIKTIGDSYMCAGGLPFPSDDHPEKVILAALEMTEFVQRAKENQIDGEIRFDVRIGVNTGPVVAGVVGSKKFAYDIWGHTVNIAARMESNSEAGRINISQNTYELVKHLFSCEYRGKIIAKNQGMLKMYFVNGLREEGTGLTQEKVPQPENF